MNSKIIFLKARETQEKLLNITATIQNHFDLAQKVLVYAPSDEAAKYLNLLLWKMPEDSFLPHKIANRACRDPVVITCQKENLNQATVLINLNMILHPHLDAFHLVYDIYDETHPVKLEHSKARQSKYHEKGYSIVYA